MVGVFLAFILSQQVFLKLMGIGMATAVLVDATLVRMVLVPALMQLLGRRNWWIPGWLDRILPRLDTDVPHVARASEDRPAGCGVVVQGRRAADNPAQFRPATADPSAARHDALLSRSAAPPWSSSGTY
jgi:hypothetical protein